MFGGVLIASRGAIACRIQATLRRMRIRAAAIYSEADRHSLHVRQADEAIAVGSYGSLEQVMDAARKAGAQAIHPGDGPLSEESELAEACADQGIVFIGPTPEQLRTFREEDFAGGIAQHSGIAPSWDADVVRPRHIAVHIFGDGAGAAVALGEMDCSAQRSGVTVLGETPAPGLTLDTRDKLLAAAIRIGKAVRYRSAGTVEFIFDKDTEDFYFRGVTPRLQPEHALCEETTGVDVVEWMIRLAAGELPRLERMRIRAAGSAMQARIAAEDPAKDFQPVLGPLAQVEWPAGARIETWVESGLEVEPGCDPTLAQIIVRAGDRAAALHRLGHALAHCRVAGIETNLSYLRQVAADPAFEAGGVATSFLQAFEYERHAIEVIEPGAETTVQDYPGRLGYEHAGVPPSGPMDGFALRMANRLAGNAESAAALEVAGSGPALRFAGDAVIAIAGADFGAKLDGAPAPLWRSIAVSAGSLLEMTEGPAAGYRAYVAVAGGIDVPEFLESRSTYIPGRFGGHGGRGVRAGDVLSIGDGGDAQHAPRGLPPSLIPAYGNEWTIGVLSGPHDWDGPEDFSAAVWRVDADSDRRGVRLTGPQVASPPPDGGDLKPCLAGALELQDGALVIHGPDGPTLSGSVRPATIARAELWKIGQLKSGDSVRFRAISNQQAAEMEEQMENCIGELAGNLPRLPEAPHCEEPALLAGQGGKTSPAVKCHGDGDRHVLLEYAPSVPGIEARFRVQALEEHLRGAGLHGILDLHSGVRSLQVHFDARVLSRPFLVQALAVCEDAIASPGTFVTPSRVIHLPLCWEADELDDARAAVFAASYVVLAVGDGSPGAPLAAPLEARHRLPASNDDSASIWIPEGGVTLTGAYLRVHGAEGLASAWLAGRTVQMWNNFGSTGEFQPGRPWLLRCFDQIRFFPVTADELVEIRELFPRGRYALRIERQNLKLKRRREIAPSRLQRDLPDTVVQPIDFNRPRSV
jgi:urea carboxylase